MKVGVRVMPRAEVLDSQGRAIKEMLHQQGKDLIDCRMGKYIELEVKAKSKEEAIKEAKVIAEEVLCNPLIETFEMEIRS